MKNRYTIQRLAEARQRLIKRCEELQTMSTDDLQAECVKTFGGGGIQLTGTDAQYFSEILKSEINKELPR
jgi:hypothetical protein